MRELWGKLERAESLTNNQLSWLFGRSLLFRAGGVIMAVSTDGELNVDNGIHAASQKL